nr:MAG TPA: hypothetical protein [Caudoviricetes sp.]
MPPSVPTGRTSCRSKGGSKKYGGNLRIYCNAVPPYCQ